MDTQRESRRQVQIALYWGQTPLDVVSVPEKNGVVLAGSARSCTIALPEDLLPFADFPLLTIQNGDVTVQTGDNAVSLDEDSQMWVEMGRMGLLISRVQVRPTRRAPIGQHMEPRFLNSLLLAMFFAVAFVSTLLLGPNALGYNEVELHKTTTRYIRSLISRATPERRLSVEMFQADLSGKKKPKMPALGRPGKAGRACPTPEKGARSAGSRKTTASGSPGWVCWWPWETARAPWAPWTPPRTAWTATGRTPSAPASAAWRSRGTRSAGAPWRCCCRRSTGRA